MKLMSSILLASLFVSQFASAATLVLYTDRELKPLQQVAERFKTKTGHDYVIINGTNDNLMERMRIDQGIGTADLFITGDLINLRRATEAGFFQALTTRSVMPLVPSFMLSQANGWTALTYRARTIVYNPDLVKASELSTYEDLGNSKWHGKLCLRSAKNNYNNALVGFLTLKHGEEKATQIVAGWVKNLTRPLYKNDTEIINAVSSGDCALGIINSYYLGRAKTANPALRATLFFADQDSGGVHTNGSGVGLLKTSTQPLLAQEFIRFLLKDENNAVLADAHFEYPAGLTAIPGTLIRDFGPFKKGTISWDEIGSLVPVSRRVMGNAGYN